MRCEDTIRHAIRGLRHRLEDTLDCGEQTHASPGDVAVELETLASSLETWCRTAIFGHHDRSHMVHHAGRLYRPLELVKDRRTRAAFQLRVLARESKALQSPAHELEYMQRVRSLLEALD